MKSTKRIIRPLIYAALVGLIGHSVSAESLFQAGITQSTYQMQPRSLFSTVRAKTIGDIITVLISENTAANNDVKLSVNDSSTMADNYSQKIKNIFSTMLDYDHVNLPDMSNFGGSTSTSNKASMSRNMTLTDTMTTQVVQVLPNGNLVIQGKKILINSGEKTQIILSGIVDPRLITNAGTIESKDIANLQFAATGNGTTSRHDSEGFMNRFFGNFF